MAIAYNPLTTTSNLSLYLDAANKKSYVFGENLLIRSQEFNTGWSILNTSVNSNTAIAPDGTLTADLITNTPNQLSYIGQNTFISANTTYTISVYVKPVTTNKVIAIEIDQTGGGSYIVPVYNLATMTTSGGGTRSIVDVGNGWYRIICTFTTSAGTPKFNVFYIGAYGSTPDTVSMYLWGAQLEKSSTVNTYVPTTSSTASQSTSWLDLSGNGNTGTLTNAPTFNNYANGALSFNGSTNYISGTMPLISGNTTIEAVVRFNSLGGLYNIFTQGQNIVTFSCGMVINGTNLRFRNSNSDWALSSPQTLATNQWYHLVLTSGPGGTTGYVNGVSNGSTVQTLTSNAVTAYEISRRPSATSEYINGDISFVKVYNRFFSESDVLNNFAAIRGRFGI